MKVLLANKFFRQAGGAEAVYFQEREHLLSNGVDVVDFAMADPRNAPSPYEQYFVSHRDYHDAGGAMNRLVSGLQFVHSREAVHKISRLIDDTRPDLVHCHNIYHQLTPSIIGAARRKGVPVVLTLHDYKPVCPVYTRLNDGSPCSRCASGQFRHVLTNRCADGSLAGSALMYAEATYQRLAGSYEAVDRFIAPSRFMAESVSARFPMDRISVLYNGVDAEAAASAKDEGYILYFGRLSAEKGIGTLLQAAEQLKDTRVLVAGTGPLEQSLQQRFPSAEFLGFQDKASMQALVAAAGTIVVPSEWYENCPMSVLEAMAAGKPVVASRIGGIPELVRDGETGRLYEPGDRVALAQILTTLSSAPAERARMGNNAKSVAIRNFSHSAHNDGLMAIYQNVLSSAPAS